MRLICVFVQNGDSINNNLAENQPLCFTDESVIRKMGQVPKVSSH